MLLPLQRIGNNVEAFRYYLALKSGQFQLTKDSNKMTSCAYVVIYLPVNRWTIYVHKAWDHFLLLVSGQSRASMQQQRWFPRFSYLLIFLQGTRKLKDINMLTKEQLLFFLHSQGLSKEDTFDALGMTQSTYYPIMKKPIS